MTPASLIQLKKSRTYELASSCWFHAMRDWYTHTDLLLAGMWGGVGNVLPGPDGLMRAYSGWRMENDHLDQDVLSETVCARSTTGAALNGPRGTQQSCREPGG